MACTRKKQCLYGDVCPTARSDEYNLIDASCYKPLKQTNDEWFCGLSTEEKAEWLSKRSEYYYISGTNHFSPKIMSKEEWEMWLKQPHANEETNVN